MRFKNKRENRGKSFLIYALIILLIAIGIFVFFSPIFEKNKPTMSIKDELFWNLKTPLKLSLKDDNEISSYEFTFIDGDDEIKLDTQVVNREKGSIDLKISAPKVDKDYNPENAIVRFEVYDNSKWNFFMGNKLDKEFKLKVDKISPVANILSNTYLIKQGGSAVVVVEVKDENLDDFYISFNNEERFELFPFRKENFFISFIAWPIGIKEFKRFNLVAIDKAGNETITKIPLYIKKLKPKIDNMKISDDFIENVSAKVLEKSGYTLPDTNEEIFIEENRELRAKNIETIKIKSRENMQKGMFYKFNIRAFKQLRASLTFAKYGERRHYYYKGKRIDKAWHLGVDWASIPKAKIYTTNSGKVIFNEYLGIYGNAIIIDHGFGIGSLYAHTNRTNVELNQKVKAGAYIANTGSTGAVFGDHLHFGILVQGIEVNPDEWLSRYWIRENVTKIIKRALKVIDSK